MKERQPIGLRVYWSKRERDIVYWHDKRAPDGHLLHVAFSCPMSHGKSLVNELSERGFDITTLRFKIRRKAESGEV